MTTQKIFACEVAPETGNDIGWRTTFNGKGNWFYGKSGAVPSIEQVIDEVLTKLGCTAPLEYVPLNEC